MARKKTRFNRSISAQQMGMGLFVLLILLAAGLLATVLVMNHFREKVYEVKNAYYGFGIKIPYNWVAEENITYQGDVTSSVIKQCQESEDGDIVEYRVGEYRFWSKNAIVQLAIDCIPQQFLSSSASTYIAGASELVTIRGHFKFTLQEHSFLSANDQSAIKSVISSFNVY